jgi:hypothetical protein
MKTALFFATVAAAACTGRSLTQSIEHFGYSEMQPPSTILPPGTIVYIQDTNPFQGGIVCTQRAAVGENPPLEESQTESSSLKAMTKGNMKLGADYLQQIKADTRFEAVKDVSMTLSNVQVLEIPDSYVWDSVSKRSPGCRKAMAARIAHHQKLTMIKSVLKADVTYNVSFSTETGLSAQAKVEAIKGLAANLGVDATTASENSLSGAGLYWGVRDDKLLIRVAFDHRAEPGAKSVPAIPAGSVVGSGRLDPHPDAD